MNKNTVNVVNHSECSEIKDWIQFSFSFRVPRISLEESKGLTKSQIEQLTNILIELATTMLGEEMIYELAQKVEKYLYENNKRPGGSLYDQMKLDQKKRDEVQMQLQQLKLNEEHQAIRDEVLKRKELHRNDAKQVRDIRRSISETSPSHRTLSQSDNTDNCSEHRKSETLYFQQCGRIIQKGACLGKNI